MARRHFPTPSRKRTLTKGLNYEKYMETINDFRTIRSCDVNSNFTV